MKTMLAVFMFAASAGAAGDSPLAGVYEGEMNGQPAVRVTFTEAAGKLNGTILFYFQERGEDGKWHVKNANPGDVAMLAVKADGKSVRFEVQHHKRHGGTELGPNVPFRFDLTGKDEGRLFKMDSGDGGEGLKMVRRK